MNAKIFSLLAIIGLSTTALADDVLEFQIPFNRQLNSEGSVQEGSVQVNLDTSEQNNFTITNSFYGADTHGFSPLPTPNLVTPLQLGFVKLGGNLYSMYNWELDAYYDRDDHGIFYAYSPLERRLQLIQNGYNATPMFQINMLGWQPDYDSRGYLTVQKTADAQHAADAISFLNGVKKLNLEHILMGNEPFQSDEIYGKPIPSADEYIQNYIQYALALRIAQEKISGNANDIKLWGPEIATGWTGWQTTHPNDCVRDESLPEKMKCSYGEGKFSAFMPYFLSRLSQFERDTVNNPKKYKMLDYISLHYYPLFRSDFTDPNSIILNKDGNQNIAGMLESVNLWDSESYINHYDSASPKDIAPNIIAKFKNWRAEFYPDAKLAVTEFGIDSVANIAYNPIVRPLYLADLMARLKNSGVDTFVNSFLQSGKTDRAWAMINDAEKTRLYKIYNLYSRYYLGTVLKTNDNFGDKINSYSVKNGDETNVFLINKDKKERTTSITFKTGDNVSDVTQISLPPWSVTVLTVPENREQLINVHQYGAKEMGIQIESGQKNIMMEKK